MLVRRHPTKCTRHESSHIFSIKVHWSKSINVRDPPDSLSPKAQVLLNISAMFGGSTSPVAYRERRSRSIPGFNDSRKAFVVRFQVLEKLVRSLRSTAGR